MRRLDRKQRHKKMAKVSGLNPFSNGGKNNTLTAILHPLFGIKTIKKFFIKEKYKKTGSSKNHHVCKFMARVSRSLFSLELALVDQYSIDLLSFWNENKDKYAMK